MRRQKKDVIHQQSMEQEILLNYDVEDARINSDSDRFKHFY